MELNNCLCCLLVISVLWYCCFFACCREWYFFVVVKSYICCCAMIKSIWGNGSFNPTKWSDNLYIVAIAINTNNFAISKFGWSVDLSTLSIFIDTKSFILNFCLRSLELSTIFWLYFSWLSCIFLRFFNLSDDLSWSVSWCLVPDSDEVWAAGGVFSWSVSVSVSYCSHASGRGVAFSRWALKPKTASYGLVFIVEWYDMFIV